MITLTGQQLIAGVPSGAGQNGSIAGINPRTKAPTGYYAQEATAAQIDAAVRAASEAFSETRGYRAVRLAGFLDTVAAEIEALGEQLLHVADEETGLGLPRLTGERGRTTGQLRQFAALLREGSYVEAIIDRALPDRQPAPRPDIRRMLQPIGPVAVFSASNFPFAFAVAGGDTASAFAAGCPVVVKGHPSHPATSELFGRAVSAAVAREGFPAGFFSLIQGREIATGQALVIHPGIQAVGFTGSIRAGRAIYDAAAARPTPIPVYAEMGRVNPMVILPGALAARGTAVADGLVHSVTLGSGQFCTNPGLVFVIDGPQTQAFIAAVTDRMGEAQSGTLLNEYIEEGLGRAVERTIAEANVRSLTGARALEGTAYCYANTVLQTDSASFRANPQLQEEHFGPVTLFVVSTGEDDLLDTLHVLVGNLTATIHAEAAEEQAAAAIISVLREKVGRIIWNGFPTGVEVVYAMQHGGPYPATTAPATTSVGKTAIKRFLRPVAYQDLPDALLPPALQRANPLGIWRIVDDEWTKGSEEA